MMGEYRWVFERLYERCSNGGQVIGSGGPRLSQVPWALGRQGSTKRRLASASGAIVEYIGSVVYIAGTRTERKRAREYDSPRPFHRD
jgi:hypothetical protein